MKLVQSVIRLPVSCRPSSARAQQGMALILVLWTMLALSVMLGSMTYTVRGDLQAVFAHKEALVAKAVASAALNTVLQELVLTPPVDSPAEQSRELLVGDVVVRIVKTPLSGWIDINHAPAPLLALIFRHRLELSQAQSEQLAAAVLETRGMAGASNAETGFEAPEDLLRVPGMTYERYARLADWLTTDLKTGDGRINPLAAPVELLVALTGGDASQAAAIVGARSFSGPPPDLSRLDPGMIQTEAGGPFRLKAIVSLSGDRSHVLEWTIYMTPDSQTGLPWRNVRTRQFVSPS